MGKYQLKTINGYDLFDVASSFQKSIRRGLEDESFYWGVELYLSGFDEYAWKRMRVIVSEDIGLANPTLPIIIQALYQTYGDLKKKATHNSHPEKQPFTQALLTLVRSPKSRLGDWAVKYHWRIHTKKRLEVPDWAYDQHTQKGRMLKRGLDYFYNQSSKLVNHSIQEKENFYKGEAYKLEQEEAVVPEPVTPPQQESLLEE